ncbi:MAG: hypothetical protein K0R87_1547 [Pseudonocardia sp.]|jgi:hypothetical protein|nr:hypothetical protein [Pseudonocardia sp.]
MTDTLTAPSVHDLLLALAGRLDDDLLAWTRELAAVGEEDEAIELATAALAAERVVLPASLRAALVAAARAARTDLDAERALPPGSPGIGTPHRFATEAGGGDAVVAAVTALPPRRLAGCTVHLTWRTTPAGAAPGPLPHPVVLVEADPDRSTDVLAYQLAAELERADTPASVEVFTSDAALPAYHAAALRTAREIARGTVVPTVLAGGGTSDAPATAAEVRDAVDDRQLHGGRRIESAPGPLPREEPAVRERTAGVDKDPLVDPLSGPLLATVLDPTVAAGGPGQEPDADAAPVDPLDDASAWLAPRSTPVRPTFPADWEEDWRSGEWAMPPAAPPSPSSTPVEPYDRPDPGRPPAADDRPAVGMSLFESPTPQFRPDPPTLAPVRDEPSVPEVPLFGGSDEAPLTAVPHPRRRGRRRRPEPAEPAAPGEHRDPEASLLFDRAERDRLAPVDHDLFATANGTRNGHGRTDRTRPDAAD